MPWASNPNPAYGKAAWKRARAAQLARDRHRCQVAGPGCTGKATQVDHIFGLDADPGHKHLRSVCSTCHKAITSRQGNRGHKQPAVEQRTKW
jgi:5-methylcytosine-specific restriction protein A